jgi:hypothetical protein
MNAKVAKITLDPMTDICKYGISKSAEKGMIAHDTVLTKLVESAAFA